MVLRSSLGSQALLVIILMGELLNQTSGAVLTLDHPPQGVDSVRLAVRKKVQSIWLISTILQFLHMIVWHNV